ncbi:hypothetical protein [Pseudomonas aeruginosa]|uniref:hypothetical protein n=1 Tax=Pseudomonas aeruginosa TaxID=287 RepID=UPI000B506F3D|nr:hypothetical protein [Pseudomonas aeruginosa]ASD11682.1 hypothetical protein CD800_22360 [Pseudomonas aeruginosa]
MLHKLIHSQSSRLTATCHGVASNADCPETKGVRFTLTIEIGRFGNLDEAIEQSVAYVREQRFEEHGDGERFVAMALHVDIRDEQEELVLRGIVLGQGLDWCMPARTRKEARNISTQIERLSEEYVRQDFLVDRVTAERLGFDAVDRIAERLAFLEGSLVSPAWRDRCIWTLKKHLRQQPTQS